METWLVWTLAGRTFSQIFHRNHNFMNYIFLVVGVVVIGSVLYTSLGFLQCVVVSSSFTLHVD